MGDDVFEREVADYDAWYDTPAGADLFRAEVGALTQLLEQSEAPQVEIGVGTGRFAAELAIKYGVDIARAPLGVARRRGIEVALAAGEALPFRDNAFGQALFVFTLCFVDDPALVISEAARVVQPGGSVILGVVPAQGPLGRHYQRLGAAGHRYYRDAKFFKRDDLQRLIQDAGLVHDETRSTLFGWPSATSGSMDVRACDDLSAGFVAKRATFQRR